MADNALDAFMKIVVALQESEEIREVISRVRQTPGADPRYRLHLGFGLHFGWAIEGAIGSSLKVLCWLLLLLLLMPWRGVAGFLERSLDSGGHVRVFRLRFCLSVDSPSFLRLLHC